MGRFVSLGNVPGKAPNSLEFLIERAVDYVQLGAGATVRDYILGRGPTWTPIFEGCAITAAILATLWAVRGVAPDGHRRSARLVLALLAAWLVIGIELPLLPSPTGVHHQVLGTPFQYAALALAVGWLFTRNAAMRIPRGRIGLVVLLVAVVLAGRAPTLITLERDLAAGAASARFAPSLTRLGEIAGGEPADAMFVAVTWGVATQIVSLSNNQMAVDEAFWTYAPGDLPSLLDRHLDKRVFYLVALETLKGLQDRRGDIEHDFASSAAVAEEPVPAPLDHLAGIAVRRYVRRSGAGTTTHSHLAGGPALRP